MKQFIERIVNDWWEHYEETCSEHSQNIAHMDEVGEDNYFHADADDFKYILEQKYPEYIFQYAEGRWFLVSII